MTKKKKMGGARVGAGRKKTGRTTNTISFSVPFGYENEIRTMVKARVAQIRGKEAAPAPKKKPVAKGAAKKIVPKTAHKQAKLVTPAANQFLENRRKTKGMAPNQ